MAHRNRGYQKARVFQPACDGGLNILPQSPGASCSKIGLCLLAIALVLAPLLVSAERALVASAEQASACAQAVRPKPTEFFASLGFVIFRKKLVGVPEVEAWLARAREGQITNLIAKEEAQASHRLHMAHTSIEQAIASHPKLSAQQILERGESFLQRLKGMEQVHDISVEETLPIRPEKDIAAEEQELMVAAKSGDIAKTKDLIAKGVNLDAKDAEHWTPLHWAAKYLHHEIMELLLQHGANPQARSRQGNTPLHVATSMRRATTKMLELLFQKGASVNAKNLQGWTPLHWAAWHGRSDMAEWLLRHGANPNVKESNGGMTPLHGATRHMRTATVQLLLENGADVNMEDHAGETALHAVVDVDHLEIGSLLLEHGADPNSQTKVGTTPLHWAAGGNRIGMVELLLKHGADPSIANDINVTPLSHAQMNGYTEVVKLLQQSNKLLATVRPKK